MVLDDFSARVHRFARVHSFSGTGHSISLTDPEQYARVIREFL